MSDGAQSIELAQATVAVHPWASRTGRPRAHRTLNAPLHLSTQWEGASLRELAELFNSGPDRGFYTRFGHPTNRLAEEKLAQLEGAEDALVFSSGMAAVTTSLLAVLAAGDHIVAHRAIFGQTIQFFEYLAEAFKVEVTWVDATDVALVQAALRPTTRLLYLETPSNPIIDVLDIEALARMGHASGALVFVDTTFAGPLIQQPLSLGADLSLQSASKSLAGHADVLAGCVAGASALIARVREMRTFTGPSLDPHASWLLMRSLQTLPLRVRAQSETAMRVAQQLEASRHVSLLRYPFLTSHPAHDVARRQMRCGGSMVSFGFHGGLASTRHFADALAWIPLASSLGSVFTTLEVPDELDFSPELIGTRTEGFAMPPGFIRLSIGAESADDIIADIARGLDALSDT